MATKRLILAGILYTVFLIVIQQSITSYNLISLIQETSISNSDQTIQSIEDTDSIDIYNTKAIALPSIRIEEKEDSKIDRQIYGGKGDKGHLGGFTKIDIDGIR